ncbi:hypothetical protein SISSUDRAFT_1040894 [Sistotremastrum suecicum HHB10207 ss-3]|uniref:Uncharacterized protein n=1 Tax=Sistotremastrum suecicum HHB10207 ss-3 TaxID=1314776 RepID=A0A166HR98_9AGAM|nr:hypothetical protein SISSUDRAFT_1040894 [Sistotremastrum suecicum HHB10207 ss-3]
MSQYQMAPEDEEALIQSRVNIDERPLRRLAKKFHTFSSLASSTGNANVSSFEEAREAFLLELSSYHLLLSRSLTVWNAESRQIAQYHREKQRIEQEQITQTEQIAGLKVTLEEAQLFRRRKMEYDQVAEKINSLPSRAELVSSIESLEAEISSIAEDEVQLKKNVETRRERLNRVLSEIQFANRVGREDVPEEETVEMDAEDASEQDPDSARDGEHSATDDVSVASTSLNPFAQPFRPTGVSGITPLRESVLRRAHESSASISAAPSPTTAEEGEEREDIEMGEVSEEPRDKLKKRIKEDLEEGEASDQSSELSEPPEE